MNIRKLATGCLILLIADIVLFSFLVSRNKEVFTVMAEKEDSDCSTKMEAPKVALTFDDGPNALYTPKLLDGLKKRGVKATFFVIGKSIKGNEKIIKRMAKEGHVIGNHTFDHVQLNTMTIENACSEVDATSEAIYKITGKEPEFLRAPFGEWNKSFACNTDLIEVRWTIDTLDWTTEDVSAIIRKGTKNIKDNDIILMHDVYDSSVTAALAIVDELQKRGFEFVTVDEIVLD